MLPKRPINADVPAAEEAPAAEEKPTAEREAPRQPEPKQRSSSAPKPLAPKLLAGLVLLAVVFIVLAVVGGSGGGKDKSSTSSPAPAPATTGDLGGSTASQTAETLGYPAFATNNTTRIGGSTPAATAAGVALAVYPSSEPSQRPAAVTLVGEEDWAEAIAAAALMAQPVGAPLLYSAPGGLPEPSAEALAALDPQGSKDSGGASLFAVGAVALPDGSGAVTRVDSGNPASTAAQIATLRERLAGKPPQHFILVPTSSPEFALPAAAWAARSGDPVLYTDRDSLPQPTAAFLEKHRRTPVYALGPPSAIADKVLAEATKAGGPAKRVAGNDPVATAIALARFGDGGFGWDVNDPGHGFVLARSDAPLEAAAAAPLSGSGTWGPLLLTDDAGTLPAAVRSYLLDVKPGYTSDPTRAFYNRVWVIGDQEAIDVNQQAEVNTLAELAKIGGGE
jgi:putative cell wall binding repeat protein